MPVSPNISWLTDDLAVGGSLPFYPDDAYRVAQSLVDLDVRTVIDMREETDDEALWKDFPEVEYIWLGTDDREGHTIPNHVWDGVSVGAAQALVRGGKVLVHCHMGINRGPSAAYRILLDRGWDFIQAYDLIREKRPVAGLYYAKGALQSFFERFNTPVAEKAALDALQAHIDMVWTQDQIGAINHHIANRHKEDAAALLRLRMENAR